MAGGGATVAGVTGVCKPEGEGAWKGGGALHPDPRTHDCWTEEAEGGMFKFAVWKDQIFSAAKIWVL